MKSTLAVSIAALCIVGAAAYVAYGFLGTAGVALAVVVTSPLIALAVLAPIGIFASASITFARQVAYRDIEGRYYEFKGSAVDIMEDSMSTRWLRTSDVRKILPAFPKDAALQKIYPDGIGYLESPKVIRISAGSLDDYLHKATNARALRFRQWLRRVVIHPSEHWRSGTGSDSVALSRDETAT